MGAYIGEGIGPILLLNLSLEEGKQPVQIALLVLAISGPLRANIVREM